MNKKVFISYSWDNEEHKEWVLELANQLRKHGVESILDRYYLNAGKNISTFVEDNLKQSERVLMIFTQNYKLKAEGRKGGVGHEYSIINHELMKDIKENKKIIPILREGTPETSIPLLFQPYLFVNFVKDEDFKNEFENLLRVIFEEPKIKAPSVGIKPNFDNPSDKTTKITFIRADEHSAPLQGAYDVLNNIEIYINGNLEGTLSRFSILTINIEKGVKELKAISSFHRMGSSRQGTSDTTVSYEAILNSVSIKDKTIISVGYKKYQYPFLVRFFGVNNNLLFMKIETGTNQGLQSTFRLIENGREEFSI